MDSERLVWYGTHEDDGVLLAVSERNGQTRILYVGPDADTMQNLGFRPLEKYLPHHDAPAWEPLMEDIWRYIDSVHPTDRRNPVLIAPAVSVDGVISNWQPATWHLANLLCVDERTASPDETVALARIGRCKKLVIVDGAAPRRTEVVMSSAGDIPTWTVPYPKDNPVVRYFSVGKFALRVAAGNVRGVSPLEPEVGLFALDPGAAAPKYALYDAARYNADVSAPGGLLRKLAVAREDVDYLLRNGEFTPPVIVIRHPTVVAPAAPAAPVPTRRAPPVKRVKRASEGASAAKRAKVTTVAGQPARVPVRSDGSETESDDEDAALPVPAPPPAIIDPEEAPRPGTPEYTRVVYKAAPAPRPGTPEYTRLVYKAVPFSPPSSGRATPPSAQ